MKLGERLHQLRKEKGIKQEELGRQLGVSKSTISAYEHGKCQPDFSKLVQIARFFKVTTDYLLGVSDEKYTELYLRETFCGPASYTELLEMLEGLRPETRQTAIIAIQALSCREQMVRKPAGKKTEKAAYTPPAGGRKPPSDRKV